MAGTGTGTGTGDPVRWVCERAEANHSLSRCPPCEWFQLQELAPLEVNIRLPGPECLPKPPRLAWFMCITPATDALSMKHLEYAKAAIVSARLNAPTLAPYILYIAHEDAEVSSRAADALVEANSRFKRFVRLAGVPLLPHRLSFNDQLPMKSRRRRTTKNPNLNVGAFGRLDMGIIVEAMREELVSRGLDPTRVLYTDTDVLFSRDVDYPTLAAAALPTFAAGTEVFSPALNTGVMLINATAWVAHYDAMMAFGQQRRFRFLSYDQTWVHEYFLQAARNTGSSQPAWGSLEDASYNARAFMHPIKPQRGRAPVLPRIWHWHGFKPRDVECWHRAIHTGSWPLRAWRNTVPGCTGKTRPRCTFMPVHNSGCRYFGRLTAVLAMTPCYLRTYTHLLEQHRRMVRIADALEIHTSGNVTLDPAWQPLDGPATKESTVADCEARGYARVAAWEHHWSTQVEKHLRTAPPISMALHTRADPRPTGQDRPNPEAQRIYSGPTPFSLLGSSIV
jgi:hypothetical protein